MMEASTSAERTPLVQPAYVFHSSLARRYQKRLRHFQCALCVTMLAALGIALLVTISYNLSEEPAAPAPPPAAVNLTSAAPDLGPLLNLTWPLRAKPATPWIAAPPSAAAVSEAVDAGARALLARRSLERARPPLAPDTPAARAQRASATSRRVKPWADAAYAAEEATRHLANGTDASGREGGVGQGPPTNATEPPYCRAEVPACPAEPWRSLDGSCNNLAHPLRWGVANTPFRRVLPADYADGISAPRRAAGGGALPSARDVSVTVHRPSYARDTTFTVMLAVWGQFIDHDITATALSKGENSSALSCCSLAAAAAAAAEHPECFPVPLAAEDPYYQEYRLTCMEFVRAAPAVTCHFGPREQLNQASSYLDGSAVYSPDAAKALQLRERAGGRLRMLRDGARELLPASTDPDDGCNTQAMAAKGRYCFDSGDARANENLHLTTMHLVWARQHNRLAAALARRHPAWSDERLYQTARKIVAAQLQHITYNEFLPIILGDDVMWALNLTLLGAGRWRGYDAAADASVANHFAAAAFRFAHTLLPGLIHNVDAATGSVSYTRLHDMLFNPYALYGAGGARGAVRGAALTPLRGAEPHVTAELSNHLFERASDSSPAPPATSPAAAPCGLDLVSLNIQRGRDHGLPPYVAWRELCGAPRPRSFDDLKGVFNDLSLQRIVAIYKSVEDIDLYTGALAEAPRGRLLGATLTCLIADQFLRLKAGDRFWYETDDETVGFTLEQLAEVRKTSLAGVICANEQMLDQVQPRVMEAAAATNPPVDCAELPQPDLSVW